MPNQLINLTNHLLSQETDHDTHALVSIINQLGLAGKLISRDINKAGLLDIYGSTGVTNVQNEEQQKLDDYANKICIELMLQSPFVAAVGTEENKNLVTFDREDNQSTRDYIVYIDPVDGSSNIDVNVSIGTNFCIFKRESKKGPLLETDYLQPGKNVVAAGYIVYGASTMLVYSIGNGVDGLTLDQSIGEFILSHSKMRFPEKNAIYSINESYSPEWDKPFHDFIESLKTQPNPPTARYIGSLVADFHRNLLQGGIYLYPADKKKPQGKLRLMYEGIPFAYLAEQAGGYGSNGNQNILDIVPKEIHQRTPLFIGNTSLVKRLEHLTSEAHQSR